jgi:hypothetical protein
LKDGGNSNRHGHLAVQQKTADAHNARTMILVHYPNMLPNYMLAIHTGQTNTCLGNDTTVMLLVMLLL